MKAVFFQNNKKEYIIFAVMVILLVCAIFFSWGSKLAGNIQAGERINLLVLVCEEKAQSGNAAFIVWLSYDPVMRFLDVFSMPVNTKIKAGSLPVNKLGQLYEYKKNITRKKRTEIFKKEIEQILRIAIPHYIQIDYNEFIKLIDVLKGVEIIITEDISYDVLNENKQVKFSPGEYILNGEKFLQYVRYDDTKTEYGRILRHQCFVKQIIKKFKNPWIFFKTGKIFRNTECTNINYWDMLAIIHETKNISINNVRVQNLPGKYRGKNNNYWIISKAELESSINLILSDNQRENKEPSTFPAITIWNASGIKGLAKKMRLKLKTKGMDVVQWGNYSNREKNTIVIDRIGNFALASEVARIINAKEIITIIKENPLEDIAIILGEDYNQNRENFTN